MQTVENYPQDPATKAKRYLKVAAENAGKCSVALDEARKIALAAGADVTAYDNAIVRASTLEEQVRELLT